MKLIQPVCRFCKHYEASSPFAGCTPDEQACMEASKNCNFYKKGQPIFQEGAMPTGLYCLSEGLVKITRLGSNGKEQIIRIAKPGDLIGYKSLLRATRYKASAIAIEDCSICIIPKQMFFDLFNHNKIFHDSIMRTLCEAIENAETKITDIAYKPVRGRIAEALIDLHACFEGKEHITLTREDLAGLVGTVKETAIRIISEFKQERLIEINKRSIKVIDREGLMKISHLYD